MAIILTVLSLAACASAPVPAQAAHPDPEAALEYLKGLEGRWDVQGGDEGPLGWTFDVTARGGVVVERLKVGSETEMATVYYIVDDELVATHYCQLGNRPRLNAVSTDLDGDLHFACDGALSGANSHDELHMHGVHFKKHDGVLTVWMDMVKDGDVVFRTSYDLARVDEHVQAELR